MTLNPRRRFSIAGLMTVVLVASLGLAALRSGSAVWAGGIHLVTYAVLLLGVVGAACRSGPDRAWWLGFALFGIAYFRYLGWSPTLPTTRLLDLIRPAGVGPFGGDRDAYGTVGHCLWSLAAATIGGVLAGTIFGDPGPRPALAEAESPREARPTRRAGWRRAVAAVLALLIASTALTLPGPRSEPALWAGALYLGTWALLGAAALGFACGRGRRRMVWLGAALFGLGYMALNRSGDRFEEFSYAHLLADEFLEAIRPKLPRVARGFPARTAAMANENARIREALDLKVPMKFREGTTLGNLVGHVRATTRAAYGGELPIFVDPQALQDSDKTMDSVTSIDLEGLPLDTTLGLALEPLNLAFRVTKGMVVISVHSPDSIPDEVDYYLLAGHCVLALLAAGLGAILVPLVSPREFRATS